MNVADSATPQSSAREAVLAALAAATPIVGGVGAAPHPADGVGHLPPASQGGGESDDAPPAENDPADDVGPSDGDDGEVDFDVVARCAGLDHSDTDNAKRLIAHFGADLVVVERDGASGGDWLAFDRRHWDLAGGTAQATRHAQRVGGRIALEADWLSQTPSEAKAIKRAREFAATDESDEAEAARAEAKAAKAALDARRKARRRFAVSSKNQARVRAMLDMAAPHLRKASSAFNADPFLIVTETHTLRLVREPDDECPDPGVTRWRARCVAFAGHRREDLATGLAPTPYDPNAACPKWTAFLDRCLPDLAIRRTVQQYAGTGLTGMLLQRLMFHHGFGANGKSVFLAVIMGVIGKSYGVGLPKESIMGQGERGAGQASPDLVRLFGKRSVRIDELKEGEALREDLVKRLTGGDAITVRDLFKGYLDFANVATPHMSGNGFPKIDGTDNGIWRRMLVVHWSVTIPPEERREFDELVADLLTERAGVLNWLIDGALDFLENGLVVAEPILAATAAYREDMDPIGRFAADCVAVKGDGKVGARSMYEAYVNWAKANAVYVQSETKFGRELRKRFARDDKRTRSYLGCELHDVPLRPDDRFAPSPDGPEDYA
jgi:putative DNA primase/helicase